MESPFRLRNCLAIHEDAAPWDAFLECQPRGQFQQSSAWAQVKALEGWDAHRLWNGTPCGARWGAQLLWKAMRWGRIGYVSKGPVLEQETPENITTVLHELCTAARSLRLCALVVQPPDASAISVRDLGRHGFCPGAVPGVIDATALVDVSGGRHAIAAQTSRKPRQHARQALKRGVITRIGSRAELPRFFELMSVSCRRQNTKPNPSRVELLEALWDAFAPRVVLGLADFQGESVAGLLMIGHGSRLTFWKKGWNSLAPEVHANCLLAAEALGWAFDRGFSDVDFVGFDRSAAESLLAGKALTESQQRSWHTFNLRLGARPKLLPSAHVLVFNPLLRFAFNCCGHCHPLFRWLFRFAGNGQ